MGLYTGFDLHANNSYVGIINADGKREAKKRLPNDIGFILQFLEPYKAQIVGIVVESTCNWYWLVDGLMEAGYLVHLANTTAIQKYSGMKYSDDKDDAFWLAEMLRLNILPTGHIYPKDERPIRDLLRKRGHLVRLRTSLILSLQNIIDRNCGARITVNDIKRLKENKVAPYMEGNQVTPDLTSWRLPPVSGDRTARSLFHRWPDPRIDSTTRAGAVCCGPRLTS